MSTQPANVVTIDSIQSALKSRVPAEELELRSPDAWAAIAISNRDFAAHRTAGIAKIRVFNPGSDEGFGTGHSVVQIVNDDMSFLVDSVAIALARHGISSHGMVHPVFAVSRDAGGTLLKVGEGKPESLIIPSKGKSR